MSFSDPQPPPPPPPAVHIPQQNQEEQPPVNNNSNNNSITMNSKFSNKKSYMLLLGFNYFSLFVGSVSSSLLSKFYFNHKGNSRWVSTLVQSTGFPLLILPIYLPYHLFKLTDRKPFSNFTPNLFILSAIVGFLLGINNFLFSWGNSYLPVSTFSLLLSSQLAFTLILSVFIVKQKVTFSNLNCVVLLTLSSVLLALGSDHDKPHGSTRKNYFLGYFCAIGAGLMFSLYLPVMEKIYRRVYCYSMVVEMQFIMQITATVLPAVWMAVNGGFTEMRNEGLKVFDLGPRVYWVVVMFNIVTWQLCFLGTAGMVFLTTSLTGGICVTALLAVNVLGGVLVYKDRFGGVKVVSTLMCLWGFCSYVYGMYMNSRGNSKEGDGEEIQGLRSQDSTSTRLMEMAERL